MTQGGAITVERVVTLTPALSRRGRGGMTQGGAITVERVVTLTQPSPVEGEGVRRESEA